jgi:hypothetical protein
MKTKTLRKFLFLKIVSVAFLLGCGGLAYQPINNPPPAPSQPTGVSVSPTSPTVIAGGMQQFAAAVSPSGANQAVTWSLSGAGCTGASCGTIDTTGKYTAPAAVPNPPTVVVTAKSVADPTKAGTTTSTIISALPAFSLNPTSLAFGNQNINTTSAPRAVTLTNLGTVAAQVNVVGMNGVNFTDFAQTNDCPLVITAGASCIFSVTFTPTAAGDRIGILNINDGSLLVNLTGTGTGTTIPNNAKLSGPYAFLFSGFNSAGPMSVVGSFTADGNGNLTAGNADLTIVGGGGTWTNQGLTHSTYSVGSDSLGSMSLNTAVNFPTDNFSFSFSFALESFSASGGVAAGGRLTVFDSTDQKGTGFFVKQDPAAFSTAALNGGYAFDLVGAKGIEENVALGRFTASGGSLSDGHIDLIGFGTRGLSPDLTFTGTYSVDASGRGAVTLDIAGEPNNLTLYVVSSRESLWMETGGSGATGTVLQQSGGPFNASSLTGTSVFGAAGFTVAGNNVTVGEVQFDGKGAVTGTNDENYFGLSFSNEPITGTYTVDSNGLGRGVINENRGPGLSNFYLVSPGRGFIISGNDSLELGTFEPQTGGPFSNASLSGKFALGTISLLSSPGTSFISGVLSADVAGNLSGMLTTKAGAQTFKGTDSVAANGRTTLSITPTSGSPSTLVFYFVSPSKAVGVQTMDFAPANAAVNVIEK